MVQGTDRPPASPVGVLTLDRVAVVHDTAPAAASAPVVTPRVGRAGSKRAFDLAFATIVLVPALFVVALAALLVAVIDRRLPLYRDRRVGQHGKPFYCLKLRTMATDPGILERHFEHHPDEEVRYLVTRKLQNDPRVSRLGRFLRAASIDELPQIVNVVRGDMSVVGPRPLSESEFLARGDRRHALAGARPGLTGLWQVKGRSDTTMRRRKVLDHYYVTRWTPLLDLYVLALTPLTVIRGTGAR